MMDYRHADNPVPFSKADTIIVNRTEWEATKKDADKYKQVKDILCYQDGLMMTLEYKDGREKYAARKVFTPAEIMSNPFLVENISANAVYLWKDITRYRDAALLSTDESKDEEK